MSSIYNTFGSKHTGLQRKSGSCPRSGSPDLDAGPDTGEVEPHKVGAGMTAFWIQFAISFAAIGLMIALAAWAKIARPQPGLTPQQALKLIVLDFPTAEPRPIWIADDGHGAIARNGDQALLLFAVGDSYVTRSVAWSSLSGAQTKAGQVRLNLHEFEAPMAQFAVSGAWPPSVLQGAA